MIRLGIDSAGTVTTNPTTMYGIFSQIGYQNSYYHNTIFITGAPGAGAAQTAALYSSSQIPVGQLLDIRNNIFMNTTSNGGTATGKNYGLRLIDSLRVNSNFNLYNVNGIGGLAAGTNYADYPTLAGAAFSWKAVTGLDMHSGSGDPNLDINSTGTSDVVSLGVQGNTPIEKSGDPTLTGVATDFYGNTRSSNTPSDIGAHAGNFNQTPDLFPPVITFTPLTPSGTLSGTRAFNGITITDNNGIPTSGTNRPKVYYSKDGITYYSSSATSVTGSATNSTVSFGIDYAPIIPLTISDTIRYYVLAQDNAGNTISNAPFAVATGVSSVSSNPVNPNKYNFLPVLTAGSVYPVGAGQTYTTLTGTGGFFEFINSRTLGGSITAEITSDILSEPGTVSLNQFGEDGAGAGTYSITIRPDAAASSARIIQGNTGGIGLIRLNGTNRVKITGVPTAGGSTLKYLRIRNQGNAPAVSMLNGAYANRLNNCIIESGNSGTTASLTSLAGVVSIATVTGTVPCSFDTVSGCIVRNDVTASLPAGLPVFSIYSNGLATGTGVFNNNCVVTGNEILNYLNSGIVLDNNSGNNWVITNNSLYNNLTFSPATATQFVGINLVPNGNGSGYTITGNYIGGSSANCGGTPWSSVSTTTAFQGIRLSVGQGANTFIQNNTIKNISFTGIGTSQFYGIDGLGGNLVIGGGPGLGNTIGDPTTTNSIVFNNYSTSHYGIYYSSSNNITISYNTIAGVNFGSTGYAGGYFYGVFISSGNVLGVTNNTIGSTTVANSVQYNGNNQLFGMYLSPATNYTVSPYPVSNNTIANLYASGSLSTVNLFGIYLANSASPVVTNNTIFNLTTNSSSNAFSGSGAVQGIQSSVGSQTVATISNNNIYGLRALNTGTVNTCVYGILAASGQSPVINANRIYDLTNASTSTSSVNNVPVIGGICFASSPQISAMVTNNQITLGSGTSYNTQINGLWLQYGSTAFTLNAFNNSIYITGTSPGGGNQSSFAFVRSNNSGSEMSTWMNLRNNIFANNRTGGTGKHYATANYTNAPTNNYWSTNSSQYNLLVSANASTIGLWGITDQTYSGWVANSQSDAWSYAMTAGVSAGQLNLANLFTAPATGNLSINTANAESWYVYGKGIAGSQVNNLNSDYSGASRGTSTGYAISLGSTQLSSVPTMLPPAAVASAAPAANTSTSYTFAGRNVASINWGATAPTSATVYNFTGVTPSNQPTGNNMNQYVRVDLGAAGTYPYGATLNYDVAMTGAVTSGTNLKVSTATSSSTPVWTTNPVATVNTTNQVVSASGMSTTTNTIMLTGTENNVAPTILSFSPAARQVGGAVTIYGRSFVTTPAVSAVSFNGTAQPTYTVVNDTTITTTVPTGATTGTVSVTNAYGTGTSSANFTVIQAPTVTSFTPVTGTIGSGVTITGTNFTYATQVQVNTTNVVSYTIVNNTTITATIPSGATTGNITVTNPAGSGNSGSFGPYTVIQAPTITSFTPTSGSAGTSVTLTGTNYQAITAVAVNGLAASYTVNNPASITLTIPNGATTGTITVTNGSGTGTSATNFTVVQLPTITGFTPSSGGVGTSVVINGTNFTGATAVTFNGISSVLFTVNSSTQITATVPAAATTGAIVVTTPAGSANSGGNFTVIPDLTVSTTSGISGTYNNVTITSTGDATLTGNLIVLGNMVVQSGGKLNTGGSVVSGNNGFTLNTGTTLTITSANGITSTGGLTGDIQVAGTRTYNAGATFIYGGTVAQVTGNGLPAAIDSLVISNTNGVSLSQATTVNRKLTLGNGNLNLGNYNLTLATTAAILNASPAGYVATTENAGSGGSLVRTVTSGAAAVVFPVGSSVWLGSYTPATITMPTGTTDVFSVRVFRGVLASGASGTAITANAVNRSWVISEGVNGGSNATVQLEWGDTMEQSGFSRTTCAVVNYNGVNWDASTPYGAAAGTNPYTRSRAGMSAFGIFTVGDSTAVAAGLPIELINFAGTKVNDDVVLNWQTVSEINNSHFEVERSADNKEFAMIGRVEGAGNSNALINYNFTDENTGTANPVLYYRLKQVDFDGKVSYFGPVVIKINQPVVEFNVTTYPNPFMNTVEVNVTNSQPGVMHIVLHDLQGKVVAEKEVNVEKGISNITIDNLEGLNNGFYFMNVTLNGNAYRQKLVKTGN